MRWAALPRWIRKRYEKRAGDANTGAEALFVRVCEALMQGRDPSPVASEHGLPASLVIETAEFCQPQKH